MTSHIIRRLLELRMAPGCRRLCGATLLSLPATLLFGLQAAGDAPQQFPDLPSVRGTVQSIHGNDAIVKTDEGRAWTIHTSDNTHIYKDRQPLKMNQIQVGDMLIGAGALDDPSHMLRAIFVADIDAATVQKMRDALGKTWIAGKILKIDEARITVDRIDHHTQVIEADETTSFRKNGQSVTLMDLHVGDAVRGRGSIKNGVFVPTQLAVIQPGRRNGQGLGAVFSGRP
jgi:hypothetical protein